MNVYESFFKNFYSVILLKSFQFYHIFLLLLIVSLLFQKTIVISLPPEKQDHTVIKKSRHSIAFSTKTKNYSKTSNIMIFSVLNLTRGYPCITDTNCYLFFIDLEKEESIKKLQDIINYAKDYCELYKKFFIIGMLSGNENVTRFINKSDITKILDEVQVNYEYKEINLSKIQEVIDAFMVILDYSSKHSINGDLSNEKEKSQAKSCEIF